MMSWGNIPPELRSMSPEDKRVFNRWIKANAIIGALFTAGLIIMAVIGANSVGPRDKLEAQRTTDDSDGPTKHVRLPHKVTPVTVH